MLPAMPNSSLPGDPAGKANRYSQFTLLQLLIGVLIAAGTCGAIKVGSASFQLIPIAAGLLAGGWLARSDQSLTMTLVSAAAILVSLVMFLVWLSIPVACLSISLVGLLPLFTGPWYRRTMVAAMVCVGLLALVSLHVTIAHAEYTRGFDRGRQEMLTAANATTPGKKLPSAPINSYHGVPDGLSLEYEYWRGYSSGSYSAWYELHRAAELKSRP